MKQRLALAVLTLLLAPCATALAQDPSLSADPIRPVTAELEQLVDAGYRQSSTFRTIVDGLAGSFVIVHVVPAASLHSGVAGGLHFVTTTANGYRYLRISIRTDLDPAVLIAVLGHELQHAFEIAQARHVVDLGTLRDFYHLTGIPSCPDSRHECYDTTLAQRTGNSVYAEVLSTSAEHKLAEARPAVSLAAGLRRGH